MNETTSTGIMLGIAVARRYKQRKAEFGDAWPDDGLVALAVSDVWEVLDQAEGSVLRALDEFLALEDSLAGEADQDESH